MDVLDRAYAESLVAGLQSGLDHTTVDNSTCTLTFYWKNGTDCKIVFPKPADGLSVKNAVLKIVNGEQHLVLILEDNTEVDSGAINIPGVKYYKEEITVPSDTWSIQHNLKTKWNELTISILDQDGNKTEGDIDLDLTTTNLIVIHFREPIKGSIYIKI